MRVPLLGVIALWIVMAGIWWIQDDFRGGASPDEVASGYIAAMRAQSEFPAVWLMHPDREDRSAIAARMQRYRGSGDQPITYALVPHSVAAYLVGGCISRGDELLDELVIQNIPTGGGRSRWFVVHFWDPGAGPGSCE